MDEDVEDDPVTGVKVGTRRYDLVGQPTVASTADCGGEARDRMVRVVTNKSRR